MAYLLGLNFREYPHKIWPKIWYSTSILGSWNSHWQVKTCIYATYPSSSWDKHKVTRRTQLPTIEDMIRIDWDHMVWYRMDIWYIYIYIYVYLYIILYYIYYIISLLYIYIYMYVFICLFIYVYIYLHNYIYIFICLFIYYIYIYINIFYISYYIYIYQQSMILLWYIIYTSIYH